MKNNYTKSMQAGLAAMALLCAQVSRADSNVSSPPFNMPTHVSLDIDETGCLNHPGPQITIGGELKLGGMKARVILMNNVKGTHTTVVVNQYDVTLLLDDAPIVIPKQPVLGGVGGNPHIYLQFTDGKGNARSEEFYLGRCVQGLKFNTDLIVAALALARVHTEGCKNHPGPYITLGGDIVLGGLHANLILRNNVKGTHTAEEEHDVALILDGTKITIPKQPSRGGSGGNPLISIQFLQGDGTPIGDPIMLGRCNRI